MRVLARRHGAAYSLGEVLLDRFVTEVGTNKRNLARIAVSPEEHPVGGQLMGSNPDDFPPPPAGSSRKAMTSSTSTSAARSRKCSAAVAAAIC
jgi:hypothetical protein